MHTDNQTSCLIMPPVVICCHIKVYMLWGKTEYCVTLSGEDQLVSENVRIISDVTITNISQSLPHIMAGKQLVYGTKKLGYVTVTLCKQLQNLLKIYQAATDILSFILTLKRQLPGIWNFQNDIC